MKSINTIRKVIIINAFVVFSFAAIVICSLLFSYKVVTDVQRESKEYIYAINTEGDIIPMKWVNRRENVQIEAKSHLQYFIKNYYDLNLEKWERSLEKAAFVADIEKHHTDRQNKGYYNKFIQYDVIQTAKLFPENIEVDVSQTPYKFRLLVVLTESYGEQESKTFNIYVKGEIHLTDRNFPHNPFGMWITNYLEEAIEKVEK